MDSDERCPTPRKVRFAPKPPSQRKTRASGVLKINKKEKTDPKEDDEAKKQLLQQFNEGTHRRRQPKAENDAPVQPTFIHGAKQSSFDRGFNIPQVGDHKQSKESDLMDLDDSTKESVLSLSAAKSNVLNESSSDVSNSKSKEYREPWDYETTYYPTTLPWRKPSSVDPAILDEAEFGEAASKMEYNENAINPAKALGLLNPDETSENSRLLFFQLPPTLPAMKRSATAKGKEVADSSGSSSHKGLTSMNKGSQRSVSLDDLSEGQMGKLLVYRSGAVKLKLGDVLYDVNPGQNCSFAQEVVAINTQKKECCSVGPLDKRAIVTPDLDSLLGGDLRLD